MLPVVMQETKKEPGIQYETPEHSCLNNEMCVIELEEPATVQDMGPLPKSKSIARGRPSRRSTLVNYLV